MNSNEIFIGREQIMKRLNRDVFQAPANAMGYCYSLIGPNSVGKTTLIGHLAQQLSANPIENVYYFRTEIMDSTTFWDYWVDLIVRFSKVIPESKLLSAPNPDPFYIDSVLDTYDFFTDPSVKGQLDTRDFMRNANSYLNTLFKYYRELGIRIIITIDEFDRAHDVFQTGTFFQRLFALTPKSGEKLLLSIITISRRSVGTIAHHMQAGSDFEDAFPPLPLRGFSNKELDLYFDTYKELDCGLLSQEIRQQILYLCGRSPGLLMRMRHEIELWDDGPVDIARIYSEYGGFIRTAFQRMCTLMKTEYVDQQKNQDCMGIFIQKFIGPAYSEELHLKVQNLYNFGFITRTSTADDIFVLAGLKNPSEDEGTIYEPLSAYFVEFVKNTILPDDTANLHGLLEKAERSVRRILADTLSEHFPDSWQEEIDKVVPDKDDYLRNLRTLALRNDFQADSKVLSKLNVLSFLEYHRIITNHWQLMGKYFTRYNDLSDLWRAFKVFLDARNAGAHHNIEVLNNENRAKLRKECERLLDSIAQVNQADTSLAFVGQQVMLINVSVTARGGIRGIIKGTDLVATVSKAHLSSRYCTAQQFEYTEVSVQLTRWDENGQVFNAELMQMAAPVL